MAAAIGAAPPYRIGVVGGGTMGALHAAAWHDAAGADLAGVFDRSKEAARVLAAKYDVRAAPSLTTLLDEIDIVSICTPPNDHLATVQAAAERGVHALLEKPSARTLGEHDRMAAAVAAAGTVCLVGTTSRFYPESRDAYAHLRAHPSSRILAVREQVHLDHSALPDWYLDPDVAGGGVLLTNGIHAIDRILWLCGSERLGVDAVTLWPQARSETFAELYGRLEDGAPVHLQFMWQAGASGRSQLEIVRERDTLEVATWDSFRSYGPWPVDRSYYAAADDFATRTSVGIAVEVRELLAALSEQRPVESNLEEHRRALATIEGAYALARPNAELTPQGADS